jgi:hypothetical protein
MNFFNSIYKQFKTFKSEEQITVEENILYQYFYDCSVSNGRIDLDLIFNHDNEYIDDKDYKKYIREFINNSIKDEQLQILKKEKINKDRHYYLKKATLTDIDKYENLSEDIIKGNLIFIQPLINFNKLLIDINDMYTIEEQFLYEENKPKNIQQKLDNELNNILNLLNDKFNKLKKYRDYVINLVENDSIKIKIKEDFENYKQEIIEDKFIKYANEEFHKSGRNNNRDGIGGIGGGNKTTYKLYTNKKTNLAYINYNNKKSYLYDNDNKFYIKIDDKIVYLTKQSISYDEKLNSYFVKL